jgi:predicted Zn-dependent protease
MAMAKEQDALIAFGLAGKGDDPSQVADYLVKEMRREYQVEPTRSEAMTINGMPAHVVVFSDTSGREAVHLGFAWIAHDGRLCQYMGLAPESRRQQLASIVRSFRPLSRQERDSITVTRLKIVAAQQGETAKDLAKRTGSVWDSSMIAAVNSIDPGEGLAEGRLVKVAVRQPYRGQ